MSDFTLFLVSVVVIIPSVAFVIKNTLDDLQELDGLLERHQSRHPFRPDTLYKNPAIKDEVFLAKFVRRTDDGYVIRGMWLQVSTWTPDRPTGRNDIILIPFSHVTQWEKAVV